MTQHDRIIKILKQRGSFGMNSFDYRTMFIQLPVRIKELRELGYSITVRQKKNRSVDYILLSDPVMPLERAQTKEEYVYVFEDNIARRVLKSELKPEQLSL